VQAAVFQAVKEGIDLDGIDGTGACALVTWRLGKVTDDGHACACGQRQQIAVVFQQDGALGSGAAGQRVVGVGVKAAAVVFHGGVGVQYQCQQLVQAGVHIRFGNFTGLDGLQQLAHGVSAGGGHFQRRTVLYAQCVVIAAAPVGHDSTVKAPVPAQDVLQKVGVLVGVGAVDEVVA